RAVTARWADNSGSRQPMMIGSSRSDRAAAQAVSARDRDLRAEAHEDRSADDVQGLRRSPAYEHLPEAAGEDPDSAVDDDLERDETRPEDEELERHASAVRIDELRQERDC